METRTAPVLKAATKFPALGNLLVGRGLLTPEKLAEGNEPELAAKDWSISTG